MRPVCYLIAVAMLLMSQAIGRADPQPVLPPPRIVPVEPAPVPLIVAHPRISAYAVWDLYAVDHRGAFKPRVISTPYGAFYPLTGKPYPWVSTNARFIMPYVSD